MLPEKVLVTYASKHGSTEGIARGIADRLSELGHAAELRSVDQVQDLDGYEAVVLGSAIYAGSWLGEATAFARRFSSTLAGLHVWLFSSGPLGTHVEDAAEQPKQLGELSDKLHPREHKVFFGALDPEALGFAERMIVKAIKAPTGDFRDWEAIRSWADGIGRDLDVVSDHDAAEDATGVVLGDRATGR
jgi:menaquinone-dependent protoporphyrinogen oxidase